MEVGRRTERRNRFGNQEQFEAEDQEQFEAEDQEQFEAEEQKYQEYQDRLQAYENQEFQQENQEYQQENQEFQQENQEFQQENQKFQQETQNQEDQDSMDIFVLISDVIASGETEIPGMSNRITLSELLDKIPIDRLEYEDSYVLLIRLLDLALESSHPIAAEIILAAWSDSSFQEGKVSTVAELFKIKTVSDELLLFVMGLKINKDRPPVVIFIELIDDDSSPEVHEACLRLANLYPNISLEEYIHLYNITILKQRKEGIANNVLMDFMSETIKKLADEQNKPSWILETSNPPLNFNIVVPQLTIEIDKLLPSPNDAARHIVSSIIESGEVFSHIENSVSLDENTDIEELETSATNVAQTSLSAMYAVGTEVERITMLYPNLPEQEESEEEIRLFQILGPLNTSQATDLTLGSRCNSYGGCRMFTCLEYENWQDLDNPIVDENIQEEGDELVGVEWFTGNCGFCHKKISRKHYAIREPVLGGGWRGCYCSSVCLKRDMVDINVLSDQVIDIVMSKLEKFKIIDRVYMKDTLFVALVNYDTPIIIESIRHIELEQPEEDTGIFGRSLEFGDSDSSEEYRGPRYESDNYDNENYNENDNETGYY